MNPFVRLFHPPLFLVLAAMGVIFQPEGRLEGAAVQVVKEGANEQIVMESDTWKLTLSPSEGGRVRQVLFKPTGHDWGCPGIGGLFQDHVTQQTWPGQSVLRPVHATIGARREHDRREAILEGFPSWHDFCEAYRKINGEASWGDPCWRVEFIVVDTKGAVR